MHIVVEGPDGGGKSSTVKYLGHMLGRKTYPKMADSKEGPRYTSTRVEWEGKTLGIGTYLDSITSTAALTMADPEWPLYIFDRFSIISEQIYGPLLRGGVKGWFLKEDWVASIEQIVKDTALVVWCLPPVREVIWNVTDTSNRDMPGVKENIREIYQAYVGRAVTWDGPSLIYDYTKMSHRTLHRQVQDMITLKTMEKNV